MFENAAKLIVKVFFREIVVEGSEKIPGGPVIFAPNHPNSLLDPLLIQLLSDDRSIRFVAKAPLFKIPVFGGILRRIGAIPVVRRFEAAGQVDYSDFFAACVSALQTGDSIVIFPEGRSLPQPYMAPLKTGPARIFFMAREKGIPVNVIPVGLNYERGMIFRSSVQISVSAPMNLAVFEEQQRNDPKEAVHELTAKIGEVLAENVFQAESYRDRELMLLLERLMAQEDSADSWSDRLDRLKGFETALRKLRQTNPEEIEKLRRLLARYQTLALEFGVDPVTESTSHRSSWLTRISQIAGVLIASVGVVLNWLPYRLVAVLVSGKDESEAATFKVLYGLFLFLIFYAGEAWAVTHYFGWLPGLLFSIAVVPLSYFTLRFFEWRSEVVRGRKGSLWFGGSAARRVSDSLNRLRARILSEADALASRL